MVYTFLGARLTFTCMLQLLASRNHEYINHEYFDPGNYPLYNRLLSASIDDSELVLLSVQHFYLSGVHLLYNVIT